MIQRSLFDDPPAANTASPEQFTDLAAARAAAQGCVRCGLSQTRRRVVFGAGEERARLLILGEGPSETDERTGLPFSGPSGTLLATWLESLGLSRDEVWITNVVRCRPTGIVGGRAKNRPPTDAEARSCRHWLDTELALVRPAVVLALGGSAGKAMLGKGFTITQERGRWHQGPFGIAVLTTFHPAYLLRLEGEDLARTEAIVAQDLELLKVRLADAA